MMDVQYRPQAPQADRPAFESWLYRLLALQVSQVTEALGAQFFSSVEWGQWQPSRGVFVKIRHGHYKAHSTVVGEWSEGLIIVVADTVPASSAPPLYSPTWLLAGALLYWLGYPGTSIRSRKATSHKQGS